MEDEWAAMDAGENLAIANVPTREFSYTPGIEIGERSVPAGMHDSSDMVGDFDFILIGLVTWISTNFFPFRRGKKHFIFRLGISVQTNTADTNMMNDAITRAYKINLKSSMRSAVHM